MSAGGQNLWHRRGICSLAVGWLREERPICGKNSPKRIYVHGPQELVTKKSRQIHHHPPPGCLLKAFTYGGRDGKRGCQALQEVRGGLKKEGKRPSEEKYAQQ